MAENRIGREIDSIRVVQRESGQEQLIDFESNAWMLVGLDENDLYFTAGRTVPPDILAKMLAALLVGGRRGQHLSIVADTTYVLGTLLMDALRAQLQGSDCTDGSSLPNKL